MRYLIFIFILLFGCSDTEIIDSSARIIEDHIKPGYYSGTFQYDNIILWESIGISSNSFEEYASGGVMYQKYPEICLTKGTFKIINDSINFSDIQITQPPIDNCGDDFLLMDSYYIEELSDSAIIFWKNSKHGKQSYNLKIYYTINSLPLIM